MIAVILAAGRGTRLGEETMTEGTRSRGPVGAEGAGPALPNAVTDTECLC